MDRTENSNDRNNSSSTASFDKNLTPVLAAATNEDLDPLVKYICKADVSERLTCSDSYKEHAPDHRAYVNVIESEIRAFGGNTIVNLFRGSGPGYFEIVCDVAKRLKANYSKEASIADIESAIIMKIMSDSWTRMKPEERTALMQEMGMDAAVAMPGALPLAALQAAVMASGFFAYQIALVVANAVAKAVLGSGLTLATNAALTRGIALLVGPVGWAFTALWTAIDMAGPAYRVTIPCVIHIAMLRQQQALMRCGRCAAPLAAGANFCPNCGAKIA